MSWSTFHVAYHDDDLDGLILDAVRPLFRRLARPAYHLRHWRRGPHLRLNIDAPALVARPVVREVVGGYLSSHPSSARPDPVRLLPLHERLAAFEGEPGPLLPWYPDNSILETDHDARVPALGTPEGAALLARFYVDSTDLAFDMTEQVRAGGSRLGMAFDLMVAAAHLHADGSIANGFVSFRSHAEAFLTGLPEGRGLRPRWDRHYAERGDTLTRRVSAVVAALDGEGEPPPFLAAFVGVLDATRRRAEELLDAGTLVLDLPGEGDGQRLTDDSGFHRTLEATDRWREVRTARWFVLYRVALNFTYLHLTRLGVTPVERFLLCHLAANAVEDAYGVSALDLIRA